MKKSTLFYSLAFGRNEYYIQSQLLIISFLAHRASNDIFRIYTDNTDFYSFLKDEIEIIHIDRNDLQKHIDNNDGYTFSTKLNLIKEVASEKKYDATVFVDTDIIAYKNLKSLTEAAVTGNHYLMYKQEKNYAKESKKEYWKALNKIDTLCYQVNRNSSQWNSGVVGLPCHHEKKMIDALYIMKQLNKFGVKQHTLEQVAISVVLECSGKITPSTDYFIHYHSNKGAWSALSHELENLKQQGKSITSIIDWFTQIQTFPPESRPKENIFYRLASKWKNSIRKRISFKVPPPIAP